MQQKPKNSKKKSKLVQTVKSKVGKNMLPKPKYPHDPTREARLRALDVAEQEVARTKRLLDEIEGTRRHLRTIADSAKSKRKR